MYRFHSSMVERPHSIRGGPGFDSRTMQFSLWQLLQLFLVLAKFNTVLTKKNTVLAKFNTVLTKKNTAEFSVIFSYSVDSSLGRVPACNAGGPGSIPGRCSSIFGIWREDRLILSTLYIPVECSEEGLLGGRVTGI